MSAVISRHVGRPCGVGVPRGPKSTRAAATPATSVAPPATTPTTPLPLLPFFTEFRAQVTRLEGVAALPVPPQFASAQSEAPPLGFRSGACHADRLRFGHFIYVNASGFGARRGRPRSRHSSSSSVPSSSTRGSVSLLQGELLPSLFSFHPPLAFQVVAFDGGESWMICVEYLPLPSAPAAADAGACARGLSDGEGERRGGAAHTQEEVEDRQVRQRQQLPDSSSTSSGSSAGSGSQEQGEAGQGQEHLSVTAEQWQQQQAQRLAALRGIYSRAAAALPRAPAPARALLSAPTDGRPSAPACLLLSSAQLVGDGPRARRAALDSAGLPAVRAALSLHLNGLAAAPADASPDHVRRTAQAQQRHMEAAARRPLLCTAQLAAAFGQEWVQELQAHLLASSQRGLHHVLGPEHRGVEDRQAVEKGSDVVGLQEPIAPEFVYFDPARMLS